MRKYIIDQEVKKTTATDERWLDLEQMAQVELTSEDPDYPFEGALAEGGKEWRASQGGKQRIRIIFNEPQKISHIQLLFEETRQDRTQELFWNIHLMGAILIRKLCASNLILVLPMQTGKWKIFPLIWKESPVYH
jgi:hypothetical protein